MHMQWNRTSSLLATVLMTVLVFSLDKLFLEQTTRSNFEWLLGDGGLWFYVLGFGSAYFYLRWGQAPPKRVKGGNAGASPVKPHAASRERPPHPKSKAVSGSAKSIQAGRHEPEPPMLLPNFECLPPPPAPSPSSAAIKQQKG